MNVYTFNATAFEAAILSANKATATINDAINWAHSVGKTAICEVLGSLAAVKMVFTRDDYARIATACSRARKAFPKAEFTIQCSYGKGEFSLARVADIARAAGAGRKSNKDKSAPAAAPAPSVSATLSTPDNASRDAYASALRALGFGNVELHNIASGTMDKAAIRAFAIAKLSPTLPVARAPRARKSA